MSSLRIAYCIPRHVRASYKLLNHQVIGLTTPLCRKSSGETHIGANISWSCPTGYQLRGSPHLTCRDDGKENCFTGKWLASSLVRAPHS